MNFSGRPEKTHLKITYSTLAKLFGNTKHAIKKWVYEGKLDPTNLEEIIEKYNNMKRLGRIRSATLHKDKTEFDQ